MSAAPSLGDTIKSQSQHDAHYQHLMWAFVRQVSALNSVFVTIQEFDEYFLMKDLNHVTLPNELRSAHQILTSLQLHGESFLKELLLPAPEPPSQPYTGLPRHEPHPFQDESPVAQDSKAPLSSATSPQTSRKNSVSSSIDYKSLTVVIGNEGRGSSCASSPPAHSADVPSAGFRGAPNSARRHSGVSSSGLFAVPLSGHRINSGGGGGGGGNLFGGLSTAGQRNNTSGGGGGGSGGGGGGGASDLFGGPSSAGQRNGTSSGGGGGGGGGGGRPRVDYFGGPSSAGLQNSSNSGGGGGVEHCGVLSSSRRNSGAASAGALSPSALEPPTRSRRQATMKHNSLVISSPRGEKVINFEPISKPQFCFDRTSHYVVHPTSTFRTMWNLVIVLLLLYDLVFLPFRVAFNIPVSGQLLTLEILVDLFFFADVLLNFRTGYMDRRNAIQLNPGRIRRRYIRRSFFIDVVALLPLQYIALGFEGNSAAWKLPRLLRLVRLTKLLDVFSHISRNATFVKVFGRTNIGIAPQALKLLWVTFSVMHLFACLWVLVGFQESFGANTFMVKVPNYTEIAEVWSTPSPFDQSKLQSALEIYTIGLYWTFSTMTTVGYGDITPMNGEERMLAIFAMLIGSCVFGFIVASVNNIVAEYTSLSNAFNTKMRRVSQFLKLRRVPDALQNQVYAFYDYFFVRHLAIDEAQILNEVSPWLCHQLRQHIMSEMIAQVSLFKDNDASFLLEIANAITPVLYGAGDIITIEGQFGSDMYIITEGTVAISVGGVLVKNYHAGDYFGELALMFKIPRSATTRAETPCELLRLTKQDLHAVMNEFPEQKKIFRNVAHRRYQEVFNKKICFYCHQDDHDQKDCLFSVRRASFPPSPIASPTQPIRSWQ